MRFSVKQIASLLGLLVSQTAYAQTVLQPFRAKNTVFIELAGKGTVYSINYDRIIRQARVAWSLRAGVMYLPESKVFGSSLFLPISINALTGKGNHHLELSLGQTLRFYPGYKVESQSVPGKTDYPLTFVGVGYRYQKPAGGLFASATLSPSFRPYRGVTGLQAEFMPWAGFGIGHSF